MPQRHHHRRPVAGGVRSGVEAWSVTMVLSARAPWPRPGRRAWSPDRCGASVEADAGPDGHCARVSLRTRRRRKDVSAAQVSLIHGSRWPRGPRLPLPRGLPRRRAPLAQGQRARWGRPGPCGPTGPASSGPGVGAGLDVLAPGDRPRGPGEDLLSRVAGADAVQPGVEGLPRRRRTTRTTGRTGSRPRVCRCSHGLVVRDTSCAASLSLPGRLETDDRGGQEP